MTLTSTLGSPGIEIREVDNSFRLDSNTATTVFIPGFASQGPVDEVMSVGTMTDFETIYGVPTNAAERYFYYTVMYICLSIKTTLQGKNWMGNHYMTS